MIVRDTFEAESYKRLTRKLISAYSDTVPILYFVKILIDIITIKHRKMFLDKRLTVFERAFSCT